MLISIGEDTLKEQRTRKIANLLTDFVLKDCHNEKFNRRFRKILIKEYMALKPHLLEEKYAVVMTYLQEDENT